MGRCSRIPIRSPPAAYVLAQEGPELVFAQRVVSAPDARKDMEDKNIKLVNVVLVMLVRRILPCQHRACNLWEFDPAKHQTLLELFGSSHKDI